MIGVKIIGIIIGVISIISMIAIIIGVISTRRRLRAQRSASKAGLALSS